MNTASFHEPVSTDTNDHQYRAVSKSAVACIVFAVLGISAFLSPTFVIFPLMGTLFGVIAILNFKRYGAELVGKPVAQIGLTVSLLSFVGAIGLHIYDYQTEVPDGHIRVTFRDLQPGPRESTEFAGKAVELHNQKVFLKGYTRPGVQTTGMKEFILVGDFGDCCFGGNPKITDVVHVMIADDSDQTVDYSWRKREVIGTFRFNPQSTYIDEKDIPRVYYEIVAEEVR
ncbi:MAG: hypothetical protein AAF456_04880 [Planctomycetota bacterium]